MFRSVLVTGGAGYIGSHVVAALRQSDVRVIVLDDLSTGHGQLVPDDVPLWRADIRDPAILDALFSREEIDAVVHLAARAVVAESVARPAAYYDVNLGGSLVLIERMLSHGISALVFSSTAAVFGIPTETPIADDYPAAPCNPYGASKRLVEEALARFTALGLRSVSLRYFNAAGADPSGEIGEHHLHETHLIPIALEVALGLRPSIQIFGTDYATHDGTCLRDYVHVTDLAAAHVAALLYLARGGETIRVNVGSERGTSVMEVLSSIAQITGRNVSSRPEQRRAGDPPSLVAATSKARSLLAWKPQRSDIATIVEDAWRWHRRLRAA